MTEATGRVFISRSSYSAWHIGQSRKLVRPLFSVVISRELFPHQSQQAKCFRSFLPYWTTVS